ncbi:hypothetical protein FNF27_06652 [Cafeteria roenbergensis]|uniref:Uncharacterized protein n=1 Tax=Cafeteria roenbergensis TaxID=33653 RepID=A0A5A8DXZ8_CAFRO|nr:hypothetical protein FNF27_06652 [Cafeteria roenbergensis]
MLARRAARLAGTVMAARPVAVAAVTSPERFLARSRGLATPAQTPPRLDEDGLPVEDPIFAMPRTEDGKIDSKGLWRKVQLLAPQLAGAGLAVVGVYGVSKVIVSLTSTLLNVTLTQAVTIGFGGGILTAAGIAAGAYAVSGRFSIRPELVFRTAFHKLKNSQVVVDAIGAPVKAGALRAYTIQQGHMAFCADNSLKWVSPRVQMLFALEGSQHSAMVSLEAETVNGALNFTLLTVDVLGAKQNAPPLVVEGLQDRLEVRGQLRGFLQSERVRYIEQTKPSPEEVEVGIGSQHPRA